MANPNNALGTPNAYSGLTSREGYSAGAANAFSKGVVSGFTAVQNTTPNMTILLGGISGTKDVALANSPNGDMYTIFNRSNTPISVTIPAAPSTNSRMDSVVLYRDLTATSNSTVTDNPAVTGYQVVSGTAAASPVAPTDAQIRAAIPNGASAAYCVVKNVTVAAGTSTILNSMISAGYEARISSSLVPAGTVIQGVNGGAWQVWTPTFTNLTVGSGTLEAKYIQIGKTVFYRMAFVLGPGSVIGTTPTLTLPVAAATQLGSTNSHPIGSANLYDNGTNNIPGAVVRTSTTVCLIRAITSGSGITMQSNITATLPFVWAAGDELSVWGTYEAA